MQFDTDIILSAGSPEELNSGKLLEEFTAYINHLINTDFEKLVFILYRVDVKEDLIRNLIIDQPDSATIIAHLIIDRQIEKIKNRKANTPQRKDDISEDEAW